MDNWKSRNQEKEPIPTEMPLEERLRGLEQQAAQHQGAPDDVAPTNEPEQPEWRPGMARPEAPPVAQLAKVSADRDTQRDHLHNAQMSLVDRIADVDDERRRATTRLQKAWQTHRDEVDDRLRRHTWSTAALLILFTALIGAALFFAYRQVGIGQQQLASQLASIRTDLDRISTSAPPSNAQDPEPARLASQLDDLSITVAELSDAWKQMQSAPATDPQQAADDRITAEIRQLENRQQLASQELESLRDLLRAEQPADDESSQPTESGTPSSETEAAEAAGSADANASADADAAETADAATPVAPTTIIAGDRPFALQLIGVRSHDSLIEFAQRANLPSEVYFREETYKGRPWYVMMHSLHESAADAGDTLARLPQDIAALGPWIRNIGAESELQVLRLR